MSTLPFDDDDETLPLDDFAAGSSAGDTLRIRDSDLVGVNVPGAVPITEPDDQEPTPYVAPESATGSAAAANPAARMSSVERWLASLRRSPGPGLLESIGWMGLFFVLQIAISLPIIFLLLAPHINWQAGPPKPQEMERAIERILEQHTAIIVGVPLGLTWLILIPAGWYRQGPRTDLKLNFAFPHITHLLLALSMVMPLGFVADALFTHSEPLLEQLIPGGLDGLQEGTDVRKPLESLKDSPLLLVLFLVAVLPAVGEEFLFRGLIGRGLINRYGAIFGVIVTSIFFASVHLYPPHVLAILPVGLVIHLVYLNSRSYWLPMLFHFANNTLAVLALKYSDAGETVQSIPVWAAATGGIYVVLALIAMYSVRTRYADVQPMQGDDERLYDPNDIPTPGAEAPPPNMYIARQTPWTNWTAALTALSALVLICEFALLVS